MNLLQHPLISKLSPVSLDVPSFVTADYKEDMEMTAWSIWVLWPLLLITDCLANCHICTGWTKVGYLGDHSLESVASLCDRALPPILYFDCPAFSIQHPACAQVAHEQTWNEQSKRDQSRWYSFAWAKEYHLLSECHPGNSYAYIKWSKPCKCLSSLGTFFLCSDSCRGWLLLRSESDMTWPFIEIFISERESVRGFDEQI